MKRKSAFTAIVIVFSMISGICQNPVIQSSCEFGSPNDMISIDAFAREIALSQMEHYNYQDSVIIPSTFLDSIKTFVNIYHNAISISDSIMNYNGFYKSSVSWVTLVLEYDANSDCVSEINDTLRITNSTLVKLIDSLGLVPDDINSNSIIFEDYNTHNLLGNMDFFYDVSCIENVWQVIGVASLMPCYKSRSGKLGDDYLEIILVDMDYCEDNDYYKKWHYKITHDCKVELIEIPTFTTNYPVSKIQKFTKIFPNPFKNELNITSNREIDELFIYSSSGKLMKKIKYQNESICTSDLSKQLFIVKVVYKSGEFEIHKVVKN
jgi:hypothetical protein